MQRISKIFTSPEYIFLLLAIIFGLFFVRAIPHFWGLDETEHFYRAYQIGDGHWGVEKVGNGYGGEIPQAAYQLGLYAKYDLLDNTGVRPRSDYNANYPYDRYTGQSINGPKIRKAFSNTAAYSPIGYLPAALAVDIARLENLSVLRTIWLARIANLVTYTVVVFLAMRVVTGRQKWLIFSIALSPVALFQAAAISNDSILNAVSLLLFALMLRIYASKAVPSVLAWGVAGLLLALSAIKINYSLLSIPLIFVSKNVFSSIAQRRRYVIVWLLTSITPVLVWGYLSRAVSTTIGDLRGEVFSLSIKPPEQVQYMLHDPFSFLTVLTRTIFNQGTDYVSTMTGMLGWNYVSLPGWLCIGTLLVIIIAALYGRSSAVPNNALLAMLGSSVLIFLGILVVLYVTFSMVKEPMIAGFQGRYLIPLLPFAVYALASFLPKKIALSSSLVPLGIVLVNCSTLCLAAVIYVQTTY